MAQHSSLEGAWAPNLISPGVAKCGTTTLHDMLVAHPRITGGIQKEVRFLVGETNPLAWDDHIGNRGPQGWASQFPEGGGGDFDYWLDASPPYQYDPVAREAISRMDPEPYLLWIFRKPSARLYSFYQYARYHTRAISGITSFAQFIDEIRPPVSPQIAKRDMLAHAWEDTFYDRTFKMWQGVVHEERVIAITLEDLIADRFGTLSKIADRLGLSAEPFREPAALQSNRTVVTRSKLLREVGAKLSKHLPDTAPVRRLKTTIRNMNSGTVDPDEKERNAALMAKIDEKFAPSMARLRDLVGVGW